MTTPKRPILDPNFWKERLERAKELHRSVYECSLEEWKKIEERHKKVIAEKIKEREDILDLGCGYGRLLSMLPEDWRGNYTGVDLCPEFTELARKTYPDNNFVTSEFLPFLRGCCAHEFDWAILISIKGMTIAQLGMAQWKALEAELDRVCTKTLILEYT